MSLQANPFVGLRAFESDESLLFFGRQQQTLELLQHLHEHHFVAIVGSSGSGKSSLIRAGLIPSLKAGYLIDERDNWLLAVMKPGQSPLYNLAQSLLSEMDTAADELAIRQWLAAITEEGTDAVIDYLNPVIRDKNTNVFLLVDQFEELFRFSSDNQSPGKKNEAIDFVNILLDLAQQSHLPVYIVITMRSDFIGDCAQFYGLPEAMNRSQYLVPRLSRTQLKTVITGPVAVQGARIEQTLLNQLLNDAGDNPEQLPVLQHALMRTWDVWREKQTEDPISLEDYRKTGMLKSALSKHAEEAFEELGAGRRQSICELVFKALTDKKMNARGVRRPQSFANLLSLTEASEEELKEVINTFRKGDRTFLMPPANIALTPETVIDISHESLMRVWTRLVQWTEEESESEQIYTRLSEAAVLYQKKKGGLWRNPELDIALQWKEKNKPNPVWAAQINSSFDEAMQFLEISRQKNEEEGIEKEKEHKRRLRRARTIAGIIGVIALLSISLMFYAFRQKKEAALQSVNAKKSADTARQREYDANVMKSKAEAFSRSADSSRADAVASADSAVKQKERADSLYSITMNALKRVEVSNKEALSAKEEALQQKNQLADVNQSLQQSYNIALKNKMEAERNQKRSDSLAGLSESMNDANASVNELEQNHVAQSIRLAKEAYTLNAKHNGPFVNEAIYTALHKNWVTDIHNANQYNVHKRPVHCVAVVPNSSLVITGDENGLIDIADNKEGRFSHIRSVAVNADIRSLAVSPDGKKLVAVTSGGKGYVYGMAADKVTQPPLTFAFSGTGKKVIFSANDTAIVLSTDGITRWIINNSVTEKGALSGPDIKDIIFSNNNFYVSKLNEGVVTCKSSNDIISNAFHPVFSWSNSANYITSIAAWDTDIMAFGTYKGNVFLTCLGMPMLPNQHFQMFSSINSLGFSHVAGGMLQLACASSDHTVKLINITFMDTLNKMISQVKPALNGKGNGAGADEKRMRAVANFQYAAARLEPQSVTLQGHTKWVYDLAYNKNGSLLFSCGEDGKVMAWKPTMTDLYNSINH